MHEAKITIEGLQEVQDANLKAIAALQPRGALGNAVRYVTTQAHRYSVSVAHVDTGAMRAAGRLQVDGLRGQVYIDPGARNPRSGARVLDYAKEEEKRGGPHAFYTRTVSEVGGILLEQGARIVIRALP